jgi:hypothetical protein
LTPHTLSSLLVPFFFFFFFLSGLFLYSTELRSVWIERQGEIKVWLIYPFALLFLSGIGHREIFILFYFLLKTMIFMGCEKRLGLCRATLS